MYDVITIGSATRDVFLMSHALHTEPTPDALGEIEACFPFGAKVNVDDIHFDTGGGATNNAATFARLGKFRVAALTRVGSDEPGRAVLAALRTDRVDTRFVDVAKNEQTAYSTILSPGRGVGERTILVYRGASRTLAPHHLSSWRFRARWLYLSSLAGDFVLLKKILDQAKRIGASVVMNPGGHELANRTKFQALAKRLDFLIVNREEAVTLTNLPLAETKPLLTALTYFCHTVIMTDGAAGAYAVVHAKNPEIRTQPKVLRGGKSVGYFVPSVGHAPKNITGAGDAFGSGFLTGFIKSRGDIETALRVGALNADSVVQHVGAKVGILREFPSNSALRKLKVKTFKL